MNTSKIRALVVASVLGFAFVASTACSSQPDGGAASTASAIETPSAEDDVLDLGCPSPTTCTPEPAPAPAPTDTATEDGAPRLEEADYAFDPGDGFINPMGDDIGDKTFYDKCVTGLKNAGSAAKKTIQVCAQTLIVCAALIGSKNGTEIQKFCAAASKVATCRTSAEDARRKIQDQICVACSNTVQCGDAGAPKK